MATLGQRWRRLRIAVPLILLTMILMRLVWMQLRAYPAIPEARALMSLELLRQETGIACDWRLAGSRPSLPTLPPSRQGLLTSAYAWLASPGYAGLGYLFCQSDMLEEHHAIKLNQWVFMLTVLFAALMMRFVSSSWTIGLIVAAMLLSRGRLLGEIGSVSTDYPQMLIVTAWLACCAHFLRTGAAASLAAAAGAALAGVLFDRALLPLCFAMPVFLVGGFLYRRRLAGPVVRRMRGTSRRLRAMYQQPSATAPHEELDGWASRFATSVRWLFGMEFPPTESEGRWRPSYERGGLFRPINVPFLLWAYWKRRWLNLSLGWLGVAVLAVAMALVTQALLAGWAGTQELAALGEKARSGGWVWPVPGDWLLALGRRFDLHLTTSLLIMLFCAVQSPAAGLPSFLEFVWLTLLAGIGLIAGAYLADGADATLIKGLAGSGVSDFLLSGLTPRPVMMWLEPAILSLGVGGIYNLMKVLDTRIAEKS